MKVDLQYSGVAVEAMREKALQAYDTLTERTGEGADFLGWLRLPENYDREEYARIHRAAEKIRSDSEVLLVIGIGGSYLGARAVIEALSKAYGRSNPEILYAGNHLSAPDTAELLDYLEHRPFSINVISKSGTTTEPAIAFRIFKELLERKVGIEAARSRIYVTTDAHRGALKTLADSEGYETFVVPDDIGGRFTVLTAVGLLPIAAAGIDIDALMQGAAEEMQELYERDFERNAALRYASARHMLYEQGKAMDIFVSYEPRMHYVQEWWKQLFGESEGKEGRSMFPVSVGNTTDLHSLGQWIQEGPRIIMESVLEIGTPSADLVLHAEDVDLDGLNYLAGKSLDEVNRKAMQGTRQAHLEGAVPQLMLQMERLDERSLGRLLYFFEFAVGISGYLLQVNPFNQPGVEQYKKNMFRLLGKSGY
ncbi:MAG: glucose-6-phosphate isomerase [Ndongobacter sp.]|nr:glucose-6-phosphate isomerase [Ndongobacter sp.]